MLVHEQASVTTTVSRKGASLGSLYAELDGSTCEKSTSPEWSKQCSAPSSESGAECTRRKLRRSHTSLFSSTFRPEGLNAARPYGESLSNLNTGREDRRT